MLIFIRDIVLCTCQSRNEASAAVNTPRKFWKADFGLNYKTREAATAAAEPDATIRRQMLSMRDWEAYVMKGVLCSNTQINKGQQNRTLTRSAAAGGGATAAASCWCRTSSAQQAERTLDKLRRAVESSSDKWYGLLVLLQPVSPTAALAAVIQSTAESVRRGRKIKRLKAKRVLNRAMKCRHAAYSARCSAVLQTFRRERRCGILPQGPR